MILSRFWYVVLALALGAAVYTTFVAAHMYNRVGTNAMKDALAADSSAVDWYLNDDARRRSSALISVALSPDIRAGLSKASGEEKLSNDNRDKTKAALKKLADSIEPKFDAVWAVDANGRVVAAAGFEHTPDWELGGYSVVADALHGWIRDDAWVWKGIIYRVVARPVEEGPGGEPVGAVVGAKVVNDTFAEAVSKRTGAAVAFYANGARVAAGAPSDFDKANLDLIVSDLKQEEQDKNYQEKGRTEARVLGEHLGVIYARLPGEAWELGAGYAVGRISTGLSSPLDFLNQADKTDQTAAPVALFIGLAVLAAALGIFFLYLEVSRPLGRFRVEAERLAQGKIDVLQPSTFRGDYKKIASDINDGIEKAAVKGGGTRRAADLEQVLGPIPAQPQMSAFAVPGDGAPSSADRPSDQQRPSVPKPPSQKGAPRLRGSGERAAVSGPTEGSGPISLQPESIEPMSAETGPTAQMPGKAQPPPPPRKGPPGPPPRAQADAPHPHESTVASAGVASVAVSSAAAPSASSNGAESADEIEEWRRVFEEFVAVKQQCGEPTQSLTFDKFKGTLQRNKEALVSRHNCQRVKFTVYVKEGKAALKASPVK